MELRFNYNPEIEDFWRKLAKTTHNLEAESFSKLIQLYLHEAAGAPLPKSGLRKGNKLKLSPERKQQLRDQSANARAAKKKKRLAR